MHKSTRINAQINSVQSTDQLGANHRSMHRSIRYGAQISESGGIFYAGVVAFPSMMCILVHYKIVF